MLDKDTLVRVVRWIQQHGEPGDAQRIYYDFPDEHLLNPRRAFDGFRFWLIAGRHLGLGCWYLVVYHRRPWARFKRFGD